jgi:hypothetical protein
MDPHHFAGTATLSLAYGSDLTYELHLLCFTFEFVESGRKLVNLK